MVRFKHFICTLVLEHKERGLSISEIEMMERDMLYVLNSDDISKGVEIIDVEIYNKVIKTENDKVYPFILYSDSDTVNTFYYLDYKESRIFAVNVLNSKYYEYKMHVAAKEEEENGLHDHIPAIN